MPSASRRKLFGPSHCVAVNTRLRKNVCHGDFRSQRFRSRGWSNVVRRNYTVRFDRKGRFALNRRLIQKVRLIIFAASLHKTRENYVPEGLAFLVSSPFVSPPAKCLADPHCSRRLPAYRYSNCTVTAVLVLETARTQQAEKPSANSCCTVWSLATGKVL
ncbi:hypothetical protein K239x_29230 [Planctomycetes bacterium K23_9]|uniref:Uncharacterized protein n=1 Tax=Stieleria marina TaxID=1930275 RepID=A0A517NUZ0_9BACT|nr:hypothetical protein K239x_29230 [Planctomycetes bacterium K23_9]